MDCHLRYAQLCFVQRKFEEFYTVVSPLSQPFQIRTVGHVITLKCSLRNHFHSYTCVNHRILECFRARFIIAFKMILRKTKIFDETNKCMLWDLAVHNMSLPFDLACCLCKSELETCLRFPVSDPQSKATIGVVLSLLPPIVQIDVVHQHFDLRHKHHTNSCRQHVLNLHVPVSLCLLDYSGFILALGMSASKGSSSSSCSISTSARDSPTGSMSSPIGAPSRLRVFVGLASALLCHPRFARKTMIRIVHMVVLCRVTLVIVHNGHQDVVLVVK